MLKLFFKLLAVFILITSFVAGWYWNEYNAFLVKPVNLKNNQEETLFVVSRGDLSRQIAAKLAQQKIIDNALFFRVYARLSEKASKMKAGEYALKPGMTVVDVIDLFISGKVIHYSQTIVEGLTLNDTLAAIRKNNNLVHSLEFELPLSKEQEAELVKTLNSPYPRLEGLLFPDTYKFPRDTTDVQFLKRALDRMQKVLAQEWQKKSKNLPLKSPYEALILASIVEKESGVSSERSQIAGVFIRRINKKMRLQSDPTIIYGMGERYKGNIRRRDINEKTAYNTYQIPGLPPTPIAIPGREAIHAVLHPDQSKSLYFVADGSGGHVFSNSLKEHNRAVRKYILKK